MKIVLVGYMGSGKSTVGKLLASDLNLSFLDLDTYMEQRLQKSIPTIFNENGEIYFRKMEHLLLKEILESKENFILSTGGGTPCYSGNMETIMDGTADVFYLKLSIMGLVNRLTPEMAGRPLLKNLSQEELPEFIGKHLFERNPYYAMAKHTINCDGKAPSEIVDQIKSVI
ncbi:shikimate kinase [Flavobacteriaceae bacterium F89]|uniref:Shikimate kinase n=1 Tax=Cerina litoralis TaxID=2874477 RepID=A0AAE3JM62_9FLAO|nr:shikimate kinase [Cerina litoralis]MCG2459450.1 shikimate kinase [Cerina litoralis]